MIGYENYIDCFTKIYYWVQMLAGKLYILCKEKYERSVCRKYNWRLGYIQYNFFYQIGSSDSY